MQPDPQDLIGIVQGPLHRWMHAAAASTPTRTYALAALPPLLLQEALGQFAGVLSGMPTLQHLQLTLQCPGATSGSDAVFQAHAMTALTSLYLPLKDNSFSGVVCCSFPKPVPVMWRLVD